MKKIAVFASGSGSNAQAIADYFRDNRNITIGCILSNRQDSYVLERARKLGIPRYVFDKEEYGDPQKILSILDRHKIDYIVLAGFLWLVPLYLLNAFPNRIVNIHPALLPLHGGKGMYGINVHQAVIDNKELESGISIHYVNARYDEGSIIFQARCPVLPDDTAESLAERIHHLEHEHYPRVIEKLISGDLIN